MSEEAQTPDWNTLWRRAGEGRPLQVVGMVVGKPSVEMVGDIPKARVGLVIRSLEVDGLVGKIRKPQYIEVIQDTDPGQFASRITESLLLHVRGLGRMVAGSCDGGKRPRPVLTIEAESATVVGRGVLDLGQREKLQGRGL